MSKVEDSSRVRELATGSIDSNQAPAIDELIGDGNSAIVARQRSPEDFDEEAPVEKAKTPNYVQGVYADVPIRNLKSDRDSSRTLRRARKRLRAARRMERCTKQRDERHRTVSENRSKLLY